MMINANQHCAINLLDDGTYFVEFYEGGIITHDANYETYKEMQSSLVDYINANQFEMCYF